MLYGAYLLLVENATEDPSGCAMVNACIFASFKLRFWSIQRRDDHFLKPSK